VSDKCAFTSGMVTAYVLRQCGYLKSRLVLACVCWVLDLPPCSCLIVFVHAWALREVRHAKTVATPRYNSPATTGLLILHHTVLLRVYSMA